MRKMTWNLFPGEYKQPGARPSVNPAASPWELGRVLTVSRETRVIPQDWLSGQGHFSIGLIDRALPLVRLKSYIILHSTLLPSILYSF